MEKQKKVENFNEAKYLFSHKIEAEKLNDVATKNQAILSDSLEALNFLANSFRKNNLNKKENNLDNYWKAKELIFNKLIENLFFKHWGKMPDLSGLKKLANNKEQAYEEFIGIKITSSVDLAVYFERKLLEDVAKLALFYFREKEDKNINMLTEYLEKLKIN
uniref:Uncharacterized protein n=1 Tax=Meloidogyne hapla TaxID=6305 RepID=A0A1I8B435_MELHA